MGTGLPRMKHTGMRARAMPSAAILALLVAALVLPASAEESGGTPAPSGTPATPAATLAGYTIGVPSNPVTEHAKIDLDMKEIEDLMAKDPPDWAGAKTIYQTGKNSKKSDGSLRTLSSFSLRPDEPFGKLYTAYNTATLPFGYNPHTLVTAALTGEDSNTTGPWATGMIANKKDFRSQVVKKVISFQIVMLYALHEMEDALTKYRANPAAADAAVHALDEWWAFYAGSRETGATSGVSTYIIAEKRAIFFGTNKWDAGNGGKSKVTSILLSSTNEFKRLLKAGAGSTAALEDILKCVRAQLKVPLIQGCLEYGYKTDPGTPFPGEKSAARKGELWAFCSGVLPFLNEANAADAEKLRAEIDPVPNDNKAPSFANIKAVFSSANLNKMGLSCADIGAFVDKSATSTSLTTPGSDFVQCTDGTISNTDADTGKCTGTWLTLKAGVSSASSRSGVPALWTVSVVLSAMSALTALNL